ncbi:unnamed protein product [Oikopleura dioica]|uniref:Uncharacterized protein n=1 Tax=Oikopleura dioica TaxID=34765 RepID=E4Y949_OIKDI|nr:unnamed protein product [Oikopleura dioica]
MRITYAKSAHEAREIAEEIANGKKKNRPFRKQLVERKDIQHTIFSIIILVMCIIFLIVDVSLFFTKISAPGGLQLDLTQQDATLGRPFDRRLTIFILVAHVMGTLLACQANNLSLVISSSVKLRKITNILIWTHVFVFLARMAFQITFLDFFSLPEPS